MTAPGAVVYLEWADNIREGELVSRKQMAERMGAHYSTAMYHLERGVAEGVLDRQVGWVGRQTGWVYGHAETMPRLVD
jgi:hypothetical protein